MNTSINRLLESVDRIFHREPVRRPVPVNPNDAVRQQLGLQDKLALAITGALGTMYAVYVFASFMVMWMLWQFWLDKGAFDPYPFAFLLFMGNIVQLLLMPLIMVSQNIQGRHAQLRAEEQYKATLSSYNDAEYMMDHLVAIDAELLRHRQLLMQIASQLGGTIPAELQNTGISVPVIQGDDLPSTTHYEITHTEEYKERIDIVATSCGQDKPEKS